MLEQALGFEGPRDLPILRALHERLPLHALEPATVLPQHAGGIAFARVPAVGRWVRYSDAPRWMAVPHAAASGDIDVYDLQRRVPLRLPLRSRDGAPHMDLAALPADALVVGRL